jgi:hypothetical protein
VNWTEFSFIIKPSALGGVGVFATHDIPSGTILFNQDIKQKLRVLKIKDVPAESLKYCIYINNNECLCPERFDRMEIGWYLNHSADANSAKKGVKKSSVIKDAQDFYDKRDRYPFYAIKDIKAGDEILIDYDELNEPEHFKEDYYKKSK